MQDSDTFKYHVIAGTLLFPDQIHDGLISNSLLGKDFQLQFHVNDKNQVRPGARLWFQLWTNQMERFSRVTLEGAV